MANLNYARATIGGRLTADPELRSNNTNTNAPIFVCRFTIAVTVSPEKSQFLDCTAFGNTAEHISRYYHKGSSILVDARIDTNQYTDAQGQARKAIQFIVERTYFVDSKAESGNAELLSPQQFNQRAEAKNLPSTPSASTPPKTLPTATQTPMREMPNPQPIPTEYTEQSGLSSSTDDDADFLDELTAEGDEELPF